MFTKDEVGQYDPVRRAMHKQLAEKTIAEPMTRETIGTEIDRLHEVLRDLEGEVKLLADRLCCVTVTAGPANDVKRPTPNASAVRTAIWEASEAAARITGALIDIRTSLDL